MKCIYYLICLNSLLTLVTAVTVRTKYGPVVGGSVTLHTGAGIDYFNAVPYAKAPVGPLRFKVSISFWFFRFRFKRSKLQ